MVGPKVVFGRQVVGMTFRNDQAQLCCVLEIDFVEAFVSGIIDEKVGLPAGKGAFENDPGHIAVMIACGRRDMRENLAAGALADRDDYVRAGRTRIEVFFFWWCSGSG